MDRKKHKEILKVWGKEIGVTKQFAVSAGRILIRYKSRVLVSGKLKTQYFSSRKEAKDHYRNELVKEGKVVRIIPRQRLSTIIRKQQIAA